jgi:hypothetical protein
MKYQNENDNMSKEMYQIISEYEKQNDIECITEEELLYLIPESALYPNFYLPSHGKYSHSGIDISDYELYLMYKGVNVFENEGTEY